MTNSNRTREHFKYIDSITVIEEAVREVGGRFIAVVEGVLVLGVFDASSGFELEFTPLIHYMFLEC